MAEETGFWCQLSEMVKTTIVGVSGMNCRYASVPGALGRMPEERGP